MRRRENRRIKGKEAITSNQEESFTVKPDHRDSRQAAPRETVASFNDLARADTARSLLESAGLSPDLLDESTGGLHWGILPAIGGIRLQVSPEEADLARQILGGAETRGTPLPASAEGDLWPERRRRNRIVVLVTLAILLVPLLLVIVFGWW